MIHVNRIILSLWRTDNTEARIQSKVLARRQVKRLFQYPSMSLWDSRDGGNGGVLNSLLYSISQILDMGCAWDVGCRKEKPR